MTRVAAVDLGTNSTRLLVADVRGREIDEVVRRLTITRLGEGVDKRRRLLPLPIARVRNCLADYRRELEALGAEQTLAIATSAVRDAENGEAFLGEIEWGYGFTTQLLDAPAVLGLGKLAIEIAFAQAADLVTIQIADVVTHQLRTRVGLWPNAVPTELLQDVGAVASPGACRRDRVRFCRRVRHAAQPSPRPGRRQCG